MASSFSSSLLFSLANYIPWTPLASVALLSALSTAQSARCTNVKASVAMFAAHVEQPNGGPMEEMDLPHLVPIESLHHDRFNLKSFPFLYRPSILKDLYSRVQQQFGTCKGLKVEGVHGAGKSHSLYQLYYYLSSMPAQYVVTYIPNAHFWAMRPHEVFDEIFKSFNVPLPPSLLRAFAAGTGADRDAWAECCTVIEQHLQSAGLRWVLIFDQINKIFRKLREGGNRCGAIANVPFPYSIMNFNSERVVSIVSVSADNKESYLLGQTERFAAYFHPVGYDSSEIAYLRSKRYAEIPATTWQQALEYTGSIPLEIKYMESAEYKWDADKYLCHRASDYFSEHLYLLNAHSSHLPHSAHLSLHQEAVCRAVIAPDHSAAGISHYDRKLIYREGDVLKPISFVALAALRWGHLDYLLSKTQRHRAALIASLPTMVQSAPFAAEFLLQALIWVSFQTHPFKFPSYKHTITLSPSLTSLLHSITDIPSPFSSPSPVRLWIPRPSNYPCVDAFITHHKVIFALRVALNPSHSDAYADFNRYPNFLDIFHRYDRVYFVWIAPPAVVNQLQAHLRPPAPAIAGQRARKRRRAPGAAVEMFVSLRDIPCLRDLME